MLAVDRVHERPHAPQRARRRRAVAGLDEATEQGYERQWRRFRTGSGSFRPRSAITARSRSG